MVQDVKGGPGDAEISTDGRYLVDNLLVGFDQSKPYPSLMVGVFTILYRIKKVRNVLGLYITTLLCQKEHLESLKYLNQILLPPFIIDSDLTLCYKDCKYVAY